MPRYNNEWGGLPMSSRRTGRGTVSEQLQDLNGTVIMISSRKNENRVRGDYIYAREYTRGHTPGKWVHVGNSYDYRADTVDCQWIIHHIRDDIIALESVLYRDHYLDMTTVEYTSRDRTQRRILKLTFSSDIPDDESQQFKVWGGSWGNLNYAAFQSCRWNSRWLDTHRSGLLLGANGPSTHELGDEHTWGRFDIQPQGELRSAL